MRLAITLCFCCEAMMGTTRLKELVSFEGSRDNQLLGYGLVVGLNGTGDKRQTVFSAQSLTNMLERLGVTVSATSLLVRNMAAVIVTANLPPFAQPGTRIDVTVSAIGDAANLQGGVLVLTALKGADGQVYSVAQGPVVTGGFVAGKGGNSLSVNHPTVGRIPSGAIVEHSPPSVAPTSTVKLQLHRADFTTAARIAAALNERFGETGVPAATAESSALVTVVAPKKWASKHVEFLAEIESVNVEVDPVMKVVVNERTGTVVIGKDVKIRPAAILHGSLAVEIRTKPVVSQPAPLSNGTTAIAQQTTTNTKEEKARTVSLDVGATVEDLVRGLTSIGSTPRDIISILQNLKSAGALDAEIEVI